MCTQRAGLPFEIIQEAEKSRRSIRGPERIGELLLGMVFRDGAPAPEDENEQLKLAA